MTNQTSRKQIIFWMTAFIILCATATVFAQKSDATRRLYVATTGFELNEAAAKDALASGADINWQNDAMSGETMLITAIKGFKEAKVIKFLLDNGADAGLKDDSGKTALNWARQYNIGRDRNGREILAMLEAAARQETTKTDKTNNTEEAPEKKPNNTDKTPIKTTNKTAPTEKQTRRGGAPTADEIKAMIERKMTTNYEDHFCCNEKNKVEFEWFAPVQIGAQETRGRIPTKCWAVKLDVKVKFTKPSSGEQSWAQRGVNGNPLKEMFCVFKDGFGEWDFLTYQP